jgi:hypothetical protein
MAPFDERDMVRRSFKHIAEARDAIDQTRAAIATSRAVIERSRKQLKAGSVRIAKKGRKIAKCLLRNSTSVPVF